MILASLLVCSQGSVGPQLDVDALIDKAVSMPESAFQAALATRGAFLVDTMRWDMNRPVGLMIPDALEPSALTEIIDRGMSALPALLRRLDDMSNTPWLLTDQPPFHPLEPSVFFDTTRPSKLPGSPFGQTSMNSKKAYRVKVGDICYFAIGQIVNRCYYLTLPTNGPIYLSTPFLYRDLIRAVRAEWSGLSSRKLFLSLEQDCLYPDIAGRDSQAIRRVKYYFPEKTPGLVLKFLRQLPLLLAGKVKLPERHDHIHIMTVDPIGSFSDVRDPRIDRACSKVLQWMNRDKNYLQNPWYDNLALQLLTRLLDSDRMTRTAARAFCDWRISLSTKGAGAFEVLRWKFEVSESGAIAPSFGPTTGSDDNQAAQRLSTARSIRGIPVASSGP